MGASFSFSSEWRILNFDSRERMLHLLEMLNIFFQGKFKDAQQEDD
jgi:hypothetical protein